MMLAVFNEVVAHLNKHKAPYIVGAILSLTSFLFLIIWNNWLYEVLARQGQVIPRQVLGAAIGLLALWLVVSVTSLVVCIRKLVARESIVRHLGKQIIAAEAQNTTLRYENAALNAQLQQANGEAQKLNNQAQVSTHYEIDDIDRKILLLTANAVYNNPFLEAFVDTLGLHRVIVEHHLSKLTKHKYLREFQNPETGTTMYELHYRGREFLIQNKLIS